MRPGKLPGPPLNRAVLGQLKKGTDNRTKNIGVGCDAGFGIWRNNSGVREKNTPGENRRPEEGWGLGENTEIFALDAVLPGAAPVDVLFGFHRGANSILAAGGIPRWVTVTLLLPEDFEEQALRKLMAQADTLCASRKIEILGGQTETLPGLAEVIATFHFMGTKYREDFPLQTEQGKVRPGDAIVMSRFLTADLAGKWLVDEREVLEKRFCPAFLAQAEEKVFGRAGEFCFTELSDKSPNDETGFEKSDVKSRNCKSDFEESDVKSRNCKSDFEKSKVKIRNTVSDFETVSAEVDPLSIEKAACLAMDLGVTCMHDIGEGGVFGALRELGEREGCGLTVDLKKIPIQQEVIELCEVFDRNPYLTKSCGALLMVTPDPDGLLEALAAAGVPACEIGKITDDKKMTVRNGEEVRYLDHPQMDECFR